MKKSYNAPVVTIVDIRIQNHLLSGSPTPTISEETTETMESRRRTFSIWDDDED